MKPQERMDAIAHLRRVDPRMRKLIDRVGDLGLRSGGRGDHFTTLVRSIVGQQVSGAAANTIFGRLATLATDPKRIDPQEMLSAGPGKLRAAGLSGQKTSYILDLSDRVASQAIDFRRFGKLSDEAVIAELTAVKGIGEWTAHMYMMFRLGRPDIWPIGDLGVRNGLAILHPGADPKVVSEAWRPWRSAAAWYLWRLIDTSADSNL